MATLMDSVNIRANYSWRQWQYQLQKQQTTEAQIKHQCLKKWEAGYWHCMLEDFGEIHFFSIL